MALRVEIDWAKDGFGAGWLTPGDGLTPGPDLTPGLGGDSIDDVTSRVRPLAGPVSLEYGRDQSTALAPTVAGRGSLTLDNSDRALSPRNPASPFYGYLKPSRPVRIIREIGATDAYTLFRGHTDDNPINPDIDSQKAAVSLVDNLADFRGLNITTPLYSGVRTGEAIGYILDAAGWDADLRDLDPGATTIPWFWVDNKDALTALEEVLRSEGPPALLFVGVGGEIIFKDRHHRLTDSASLTSQATWSDAANAVTADVTMNKPFEYDEAWRNIINTGTVEVGVRQGTDPEPVWTSDATITLSAGEQRTLTASTSDPFLHAITPEQGVDYQLVSGVVTIQLGQTSGSSVTIQLTADVGGPAIIQGLQLRAQPVSVAYSLQVSQSDTGSIDDYGSRSFPNDLPWCNQYDADAVLRTTVAQRAQANPIVSVRFMVGRDEDRASAVLSRNLSDRITVVEDETTLDHDFYIESIRHELTGEHDHSVIFGLEMVPAAYTEDAPAVFLFGNADTGFSEGTFSSGLTRVSAMFRFGDTTTGHRFGTGGFAL